jgi:hypothetical protein
MCRRRWWRETEYRPGDPDLLKLIGSTDGTSFLYREAAKGFAKAMTRPVSRIALFTFDTSLIDS